MISGKMNSLLNEQMHKEFESAYLYLSIANFYEVNGLPGFAQWYKIQAQEEQNHAMLFYNFLQVNSSKISFRDIKIKEFKFTNLIEPIKEALVQEQFITSCIEKIYEQASKEDDYSSQIFLNWFIQEQEEEEKEAQSQIQNFELYGNNPASLFLLDNENSKRTFDPCKSKK